jgi:hypothetical protein
MAQRFDHFADELMARVVSIIGLEENWLSLMRVEELWSEKRRILHHTELHYRP